MSAPDEHDRARPLTPRGEDRTAELLLLGQIHGLVQSLKDGQDQANRRMEDMSKRFDARLDDMSTRFDERLGIMSKRFDDRLDAVDGRLRMVEQKAAVAGAFSGGAMAVGTALIIEGIKVWMRGGVGN